MFIHEGLAMLSVNGYRSEKLIEHNNQFTLYKGMRISDPKKVILKVCHFQPCFCDFFSA